MPVMYLERPGPLQWLREMRRQASELRLQQTASSLTLLSLLAMVPMASIALLVLTALPAFGNFRRNVQSFLASNLFLPTFSETVVRYINTFAAAAERLSAIGTIAFFATALMALLTIDRTLNGIWRTPRPRPLTYRLALYWALLTLGPVLLGGALALQVRLGSQLRSWEHVAGASLLLETGAAVLPIAIGVAGLTLMYRLVPNAEVRWRDAVLGALCAALMWVALKKVVAAYIAWMPSYTIVYGAFAALPLFLLWLFASWMSVLLGALLAAHVGQGAAFAQTAKRSPQVEFALMVQVLREMLRAPAQRIPAVLFRSDFAEDPRVAQRVATQLSMLGYLVRVWPVTAGSGFASVWDEYWLAAPALGDMTLRKVFDSLWCGAFESGSESGGVRLPFGVAHEDLSRPLAQLLCPRLAPVASVYA